MVLRAEKEIVIEKPTSSNFFTSTPGAIIIGSLLISLSILLSGGVLKLKSNGILGDKGTTTPTTTVTNTTTEDGAADPEQLKTKLADIAGGLSINKDQFLSCVNSAKYQDEIDKDNSDAETAGVTGTPGFIIGKTSADGKVDGVKVTGAYPMATFKDVIDKLIAGTAADQIKGPDGDLELGSTIVDDDPVLGSANAPVTLVEFSDYECPFCKRHFTQTLPSLKKDYIDTGKVKLVFRDFIAVPAHNPVANIEALAAECVKEMGGAEAYYKFHDLVFSQTKSNGQGI